MDGTINNLNKGSRKKNLLLIAGPLRGDGVKGRAIKEKKTFLEPFFPTFQRPLSSKGGGGLGLNGQDNPFLYRFPNSVKT